MRPLGATVLGVYGDRHGRRRAMMVSMAIMTVAMALIAALPTRAMAGPLAGWLLLALRCVMAFAVGGEYTGVVAYLVEGAPPPRRGLVASLASAASQIGGLLAAGVSAAVVLSFSPDTLENWGWRVPFLIGAVLAGMIWIARSRMPSRPNSRPPRPPVKSPQTRWRWRLAPNAPGSCADFRFRRWGRSRIMSA